MTFIFGLWNWLNLLIILFIILCIVTLTIFVAELAEVFYAIVEKPDNDFTLLAYRQTTYEYCVAALIFLVFLKVSLSYN